MAEVIPSINAPTFAEIQRRITLVEPYVSWCHLDVTDGVFSSHETWRDPADLSRLKTRLKCEAHLMVNEPEKIIGRWLLEPVRRIIVHLEAAKSPDEIIQRCRESGREIGFAVRPDTSWELLRPWCGKVDLFLLLRVPPGASGQNMVSDRVGDIHALRAVCPGCIVEIDGGVDVDNAASLAAAGVNVLVVGKAIFGAPDIGKAVSAFYP
jgi:ribulose-phosphate 3-epimerase